MKIYFNPQTLGFYSDALHGERTIKVPDPAWKRPTKLIPDPNWELPDRSIPDPLWERPSTWVPAPDWVPPKDDPTASATMIEMPDMSVSAPMIEVPDFGATPPMIEVPDHTVDAPLVEVDNPNCRLPPSQGLIEISEDKWRELLDGQAAGKQIVAAEDGSPMLADPPPPTPEQLAEALRAQRDALLQPISDQLQRHMLQKAYGQTTTLTDEQASTLAVYAQALRDVPQQIGFPESVIWPVPPDSIPTD